jgi:hypothetical protein
MYTRRRFHRESGRANDQFKTILDRLAHERISALSDQMKAISNDNAALKQELEKTKQNP